MESPREQGPSALPSMKMGNTLGIAKEDKSGEMGPSADDEDNIAQLTESLEATCLDEGQTGEKDNSAGGTSTKVATGGVQGNSENWLNDMLHPCLRDYKECFFNWTSENKPLTMGEVATITSVVADKLQNMSDARVAKMLKYSPIETIANHFTLAFCYLLKRKLGEAAEKLSRAGWLLKQAVLSKFLNNDILEGLVYVFTGLEAFRRSLLLTTHQNQEEELKTIKLMLNQTPYKALSPLSRQGVKGVRLFYCGNRRITGEQLDLLRELIVEDPLNVEWLVNIQIVLRIIRKDKDHRAGPSQEEKLALIRATEVDRNHVMVRLCACTHFSDILRRKAWNPADGSLQIDGYPEFQTEKQLVLYMKNIVSEILPEVDFSTKITLAIAETFSNGVPFEYRNAELAKQCITIALDLNPRSSKANHKMGLNLLTTERNPDEAFPYIKKAFEMDPRNFSALIDMAQLLMRDAHKYQKELTDIFAAHVTHNISNWTDNRVTALQTVEGYFHFVCRDYQAAISSWVNAVKVFPNSILNFRQIGFYCNRYFWDKEQISPSLIKNQLQMTLMYNAESLAEDDVEILNQICKLCELSGGPRSGSDRGRGRGNNLNRGWQRGGGRGSRGGYNGNGGNNVNGNFVELCESSGPSNPTTRQEGAGVFGYTRPWSRGGRLANSNRGSQSQSDRNWRTTGADNSVGTERQPQEPSHRRDQRQQGSDRIRDPLGPGSGRGFDFPNSRGGSRGGRGRGGRGTVFY